MPHRGGIDAARARQVVVAIRRLGDHLWEETDTAINILPGDHLIILGQGLRS